MAWRGWKKARSVRRKEPRGESGDSALCLQSSPRQKGDDVPASCLPCGGHATQRRRLLPRVGCLSCCVRASADQEEECIQSKSATRDLKSTENSENKAEFSESMVQNQTNKVPMSNCMNTVQGDWLPSNDYAKIRQDKKKQSINCLESFVNESISMLLNFIDHLKTIQNELKNTEEICSLVINLIQLDEGRLKAEKYEEIFTDFIKLTHNVFLRTVIDEESPKLVEMIVNMRKITKNLWQKIESHKDLLSYEEQEITERFLKISKEWMPHVRSKNMDLYTDRYYELDEIKFLPLENLHVLHNKRQRIVRQMRNLKTKAYICGRFMELPEWPEDTNVPTKKGKNTVNRFESFIVGTIVTKSQPFKHQSKLISMPASSVYNETLKKLEALQGLVTYVRHAQTCIQKQEFNINCMVSEVENIKESLTRVLRFISETAGNHPLAIYKKMMSEAKKEMRPISYYNCVNSEWPKMVSLMAEISELSYKITHRLRPWSNIISPQESATMKIYLEEVMVALDDIKGKMLQYRVSKESTMTIYPTDSNVDTENTLDSIPENILPFEVSTETTKIMDPNVLYDDHEAQYTSMKEKLNALISREPHHSPEEKAVTSWKDRLWSWWASLKFSKPTGI